MSSLRTPSSRLTLRFIAEDDLVFLMREQTKKKLHCVCHFLFSQLYFENYLGQLSIIATCFKLLRNQTVCINTSICIRHYFMVVLQKYQRFYEQIGQFNICVCWADFSRGFKQRRRKSETVAFSWAAQYGMPFVSQILLTICKPLH